MAKILYFFGGANQSLLNDGTPNAAGSIEFFSPGTTDHVDTYPTYDDAVAGTNANANPVTLDAYGRADIWLVGGVKFQVYDADDVAVGDPVDDFNGEDTDVGTATADETNLLTNGSFENWTNGQPDNITVSAYSGAEATQETADVTHGASAIKIVGAGNGGATMQWDDYIPVSALYEYLAEFLIENATGTTNIMRVKWYDEAKSQLLGGDAYTDVYNNTTTHASWTRKYAFVTPPSGACFARFYGVGIDPSGIASGTVRFDGCRLTIATTNVNALTAAGVITAQAGVDVGDSTYTDKTIDFHPSGGSSTELRARLVGVARGQTSNGVGQAVLSFAKGIIVNQGVVSTLGRAQLNLARALTAATSGYFLSVSTDAANSAAVGWGTAVWNSSTQFTVFTYDEAGAAQATDYMVMIWEFIDS